MDDNQVNKTHRAQKAGRKVNKKKANDGKARANPKAFTFSGGWKSAQRKVQRAAEISEKREKYERLPDKTPVDEAPPYIVVVQGPPGCGKSTLIRSLVKHYTKQSVSAITGPITVVVSKSRRLTFVECPNDIHAMLDLAKVADLCILMIDGEHGLELPTFEYVSMLQTHGFPRVLGVLSKLDSFAKDGKGLKQFKKAVKDRFWKEIYDGAKLFFLSQLKGKRYLKREVLNLSRFIAVQKYQPLVWRSQHPYLLPLSVELEPFVGDKDQEGTRAMAFSGYVRGARLHSNQMVHIPGAGDFPIESVNVMSDPCPLPEKNTKASQDAGKLLRKLKQGEKIIYAPMCDIGTVDLEGSHMHIKIDRKRIAFTPSSQIQAEKGEEEESEEEAEAVTAASSGSDTDWSTSDSDNNSDDDEEEEEGEKASPDTEVGLTEAVRRVRALHTAEGALETQRERTQLKVFENSESNMLDLLADDNLSDEDWDKMDNFQAEGVVPSNLPDDDSDDEERGGRIGSILAKIEEDKFEQSLGKPIDWFSAVYEPETLPVPHQEQLRTIFATTKSKSQTQQDLWGNNVEEEDLDAFDGTRVTDEFRYLRLAELRTDEDTKKETKTEQSDSDSSDSDSSGSDSDSDSDSDSKSKSAGDDQDSQVLVRVNEYLASIFTWVRLKAFRSLYFISGGWEGGPTEAEKEELELPDTLAEYDKMRFERRKQALIDSKKDKSEIDAISIKMNDVGIGKFVRIVVRGLPEEWVAIATKCDGSRPVVVGGVLSGEKSLTFLHCRVKKHRYSPKILKTSEPLTFSMGWRRFQSLPYFAIDDRNDVRTRYLKYTPEHMHCQAFFYGHSTPPGSGCLAIKYSSEKLAEFRVSMTGVVLENTPNPKVMKKLKFIGKPTEIKRNTAFIGGMFTSDLEVNKVLGVPIQTQSGIRGVIKKSRGYQGEFRATFEAKILKSDVIICKAWYKVPLEPFCNPVMDIASWDRLRTFAEVRADMRLPLTAPKTAPDYGKKQVRVIPADRPLKLSKSLLAQLPFEDLPQQVRDSRTKEEKQIEAKLKPELSAHEKYVASLIASAAKQKKERLESLAQKREQTLEKKRKEAERIEQVKRAAFKEDRKRGYVIKGKTDAAKRRRMGLH